MLKIPCADAKNLAVSTKDKNGKKKKKKKKKPKKNTKNLQQKYAQFNKPFIYY